MSASKWGHSPQDTYDEILKKGRPVLPPMSPSTDHKTEKIQTSTTIKYISNASPIEVSPPEIIINDIEPNQTYEVVVLVRNLTNIGRRIRVYQPKTNKFRCDYDMQGNIAAGLAMKLVLSFETDKLGDFHDVLEIVSDEKFSVTVPLHAYQPQASVVFDPFVNFGFIKINKEENRTVLFENHGKKEGRVDLRFDGIHDMSIVPPNFVIKPGERKEAMIRYTPKEAGIFRGTIEVTVEGQSLLKNIDISATSVDYFIFMVDKNGGQTQTFDFGDIYFGQFRELEGFLVNNSPQRFNFKAKFLTGMQNNAGDMFSIQTPYELGQEQIQRIMSCYPEEGVIDSYSQVPVKFSCKSRVTDDMIFWTRNYCMKKEKHEGERRDSDYDLDQRFDPTNYNYTCIFEFDGKSDMSPYIHLSARGICPTIKVSHHLVNFGECRVNDRRDYLLTLENKNEEQSVDFSFSNVAHFKAAPKKGKALPHSAQSVTFSFEPKSLGKFTTSVDLELFGIYKIPIKLMGSAMSLSPTKKMVKRGPDSLPEDFSPDRKFVTDDNIDYAKKPVRKENRLIFMSMDSTPERPAKLDGGVVAENIELYNTIKSHKEKYNTYIEDQKQKRLNAPKELEKKQKMELTSDKLESMLPNKEFWVARDKEEKQILHPFDFDFIFGTETIPMDKPKYALPDPHDPLYVVKPVGRYEPTSGSKISDFRPDPTKPSKKLFPSEAQSQAELRDIQRELSAEDLQKIFVGPTTIDFGLVFVKSRATRYFAVKNQLKTAIIVQIIANNNELSESYQRPQVIPPMQTAGFEIVFYSQNLQSFKGGVKYIINNKHEFAFATHAQVEPVKLVLETNQLTFKFQDKDEDMELTNSLTIINKGNAPGNFKWDVAPNSVFKVNPLRGFVPAEGTLKVSLIYIPSGVNFRGESERLGMQVENGETQYLNCIGFVNEARCEFRETGVDFGNVLVSQEQPKAVVLKNKHKSIAVFKVNPVLPAGITVHPLGGKIGADSHVELRVAVCSNDERVISDEILVNIRGGKQVKLPVKAKVIVPKIRIVEEDFDFGGVTYGSTATMNMTIVNESEISAVLNLDLTNIQENPGIQFLEVQPASEPGDEESSFILSVNQENNPQEKDLNDDQASLSMSESEEEEPEKEHMRHFNIKIKENSSLSFILKFTPSEAKNFNFELPIQLQGYGKIDTLTRYISCRGLRPRCIMDPPILEFKKKTITSFDKPAPDQERVIISNIDQTKSITWRLETKAIDEDRTFTIQPTSGKIEPGQQQVIIVGFSPMNPGQYDQNVPLYIDNDNSKAYAQLTLKGFGDFPKLLFDRRDIILPIVPVDVESRCTFKIINDGYENLTLKYEIANDVGNIEKDLKLEFPEGKQLGVTKSKLRVDAVFKSKKPMSFTVELVFADDSKHFYRIMISGTTDNCLLTNYPYLQRNFGEFEILAHEGRPIVLKELDNDDSDTSPKAFSIGVSKSGSMTSRAGRSLLGYTPIPVRELEKACENIKNWLNQNALSSYISKFPNDVIESNGSQLFELVHYLTGKLPSAKANLNLVTKKTEKVKLLYKQYSDLINVLKVNGCLLNTIRPEYLFKHSDYNTYIKLQDNQFLAPNMLKLSEAKFQYVSVDAWITIIYQLLKVYYLGRVTLKAFRNTPGIPPEYLNVPEYYLEDSNLISIGENLLLRWLEVHYQKQKPGLVKRLKNFGEDLRDGHVFSAVIQSYVGTGASKALAVLRNNPQSKDDYIYNAGKILTALEELGMQSPFTAKDIESPSQREMILFCLYLFNNLTHYIPKATIEFAGMLGETVTKHIELKNMSNKGISYRVKLEGDADFSLEGTEERDSSIYVESKKAEMFPVKYTARLSKTMTGRILFTNKRDEGNLPAAALVFDLKSKVTGRKSEATEVFQSRLYEMKTKEIRVENRFNQKADFQVELIYQKPPASPEKKRNLGGSNKKRSPRKPDQPEADNNFQAFASKFTVLSVPRQGVATIPITFIPFGMDTVTCDLVLRDDKVGELQYTLVGEVDLPPPIEIPSSGTYYLDNEIKFQVGINVHNHLLQNARKLHIERLPQSQRAKEHEKDKNMKALEKAAETVVFNIESLSQHMLLPATFTLHTMPGKALKPGEDKKGAGSGSATATAGKKKLESSFDSKSNDIMSNASTYGGENKLPINLSFNVPTKDQPLRFVFRSQNKLDIRLYEIKVSVLPRPVKAILEMRCGAGETLKQDIPIKNDSDRDWNIRAQLITDGGKNANYFSGGKDFRVPRNSTAAYTILFKPPWVLTAEARLVLTNPYNGQQYDFELRGVGEEPIAEGHVILECKPRKTRSHIFRIKNDYERKLTYKVETDLYNASGKSTFELGPGRTEDYVLEVTPMLGGAYTGSITFTDELGKFKWWTVEVQTESPKPEKSIDLSTTIRKAIAFDISISNPLEENITFEVILVGDGLFGENAFSLHPKQTGTYELVFSPLKPLRQIGSLTFIHEKLGELCYELNLQADDAQPVRLPTIRAELGKTEHVEVELENPSGKAVQVRQRISNPHNFDILPDDIVIPPYDSVIVQIRYMPSDLETMESCEIVFDTEDVGKWTYLAFGQGIPPTKFDMQTVGGSLNRDSSVMINFKNPFKDPISVYMSLEAEGESKGAFEILLKKSKLTIGGLNVIQIPVSFLPRAISDYYATLVLSMNEKITWRFPLKGITESYSTSSDFILKTKCRVKYESELKIVLPGNPHVNPDEHYTLEMINIPKEYEKILQNPNHKAIAFTPVKDKLKNPTDPLVFKAVFQPLKPFKTAIDIAIVKSTGGRWKYKLFLESTLPDADDNITITSTINKTSSISFKLTNYTKHTADFIAGFTPDSDSEFTVAPKAGILEQYGKEGTNFVISFTPVEYGKVKIGRLVIQTEEMYWSYNIKGLFPKYVVPKINSTKIEHKLSEDLAKKLGGSPAKRNFMQENIKKSSQSPVKRGKERAVSRSRSKSRSPRDTDQVRE